MAELRCQGVAKAYGGREVLDQVDLRVPEGTLTAILGASGSGKTTLLRLVVGFIRADRGVISLGGAVVDDGGRGHVPAERREVGYVAQEGALFPHLTVAENVGFGRPRSERKRSSRIGEALDLVGLDRSYAVRQPHELSGGEQRRVALARALAPRPRIVLLDEPFSALDAALRSETRDAVLAALAAEGTTAVLVTHDQAEALSMGREVAVLRGGRLVQTAAPAELYRSPVDLDVARIAGEAVVLAGSARAGEVDCELGRLIARDASANGPVHVLIRPEQIRLSRGAETLAGASGRVVGHSYYGPDTVVRLQLDGGSGSLVLARTFDADVPEVGERVRIEVSGPVSVYLGVQAAETNGAGA